MTDTTSLRKVQVELQVQAGYAWHQGSCSSQVKTTGRCDCSVSFYQRGADALATALEQLEAAEQEKICLRELAEKQREVVNAARRNVNAVRYQLEIENEPYTHCLLEEAIAALDQPEEEQP